MLFAMVLNHIFVRACNNFIGLIGVDLEKQTGTVICSHKNYYRLEFDENEGA